jgi:hypothetical protein
MDLMVNHLDRHGWLHTTHPDGIHLFFLFWPKSPFSVCVTKMENGSMKTHASREPGALPSIKSA